MNIGKIAVLINTNKDFLKEGIIISEKDNQGCTEIQFGVNDIRDLGGHMFVLKEDLIENYKGIKKGDIKFFLWDYTIYEIEIMMLIKANKNRYECDVNDGFIAKCTPDFFGSKYISNNDIIFLFNLKSDCEAALNVKEIKNIEKQIERLNKELIELKK